MFRKVAVPVGLILFGVLPGGAQRGKAFDRLPPSLRNSRPAASAAEQESRNEAIFRYYSDTVTGASEYPRRPAQIDTRSKRLYRTRMRETAQEQPTFANTVAVDHIGCGTGCFLLALADLSTGRSYLLEDVNTWNGFLVEDHRRNSRALHIMGIVGRQGAGDRWYVWQHGTLTLMRYEPLDEECFSVSKDDAFYDSAVCHFVASVADKAEKEGR